MEIWRVHLKPAPKEGISHRDVLEFCKRRGTRAFTPNQVAEDIFTLVIGGKTGIILEEK